MRMDHRLSMLAQRYGWRYTRYADDLAFSLPASHSGQPHLGTMIGLVTRIVAKEGFAIHPEKTRVACRGSCQRVTGLVVNGTEAPRVPANYADNCAPPCITDNMAKPPKGEKPKPN